MLRTALVALAILLLVSGLAAQDTTLTAPPADLLDSILTVVGFSRSDLGYRPAGYWTRFPLDVPYKLTSFEALYAEPLKLYDYAAVMANNVETYLAPIPVDTTGENLYRLVYSLGVDRKLGGFRSYSANLVSAPDGKTPLASAVDRLYWLADEPTDISSFGEKSGWPPHRMDSLEILPLMPDTVRSILAKVVANLAEAIRWRNRAFRNCDRDAMLKAMALRDLAETQGDGQVYHPELDDIAATIDWPSLHYAALKTAAVAGWAEVELGRINTALPERMIYALPTPYGRIIVVTPGHRGVLPINCDNTLLVVDFGQDIHYTGAVAANHNLLNPVSVLIDMGGNDVYGTENEHNEPIAGVGLLGVGLLLDHQGDDEYHGSVFAEGTGLFGVGVLYDRQGDDLYKAEVSAQGCGYFGIGLCLDGLGNDLYYLYGDGQGMGGIGGGVGVLADYDGNDKFSAEPFSRIYDRGDYHSEGRINANNAQGAGMGRRGDGSDGHAWAGGLGAIIDIYGDDEYYSGNWTLGIGYWFGTGIAVDRYGDDKYKSCYFTQGSGAHFCNGILLDESGNDRHELFETAGAALGFGWDFTNAFLIDKGGNDFYRAVKISMGLAQIRSCAFLIDIGGDDEYWLGAGTPGLGEASYLDNYDHPGKNTLYYSYAKSFGGFIDAGGTDKYYEFEGDEPRLHPTAKNGELWFQPDQSDSTFGADNYGVGLDASSGTVPEFFKWKL
ncbi:MAG TPA: hypothetical protein PLF13_01750 [candidate division Zixibacteria bacterium]|nr:hypothetical protein [candidate division Zixibacteria bacterium]